MTNIEAMKLAVEWIEAQPEPRMIGASKAIAALRQAINEAHVRCKDCDIELDPRCLDKSGVCVSCGWPVWPSEKYEQAAVKDSLTTQQAEEQKTTDYMLGFSDGKQYAHKYEQAEKLSHSDNSVNFDIKQEPVAWGRLFDGDIIDCICPEEHSLNEGDYTIPLYTAPPQREWVSLTDDEIHDLLHGKNAPIGLIHGIRAIEAKLKEKNCGTA